MIRMVNKKLKWGGGQSRIIDITPSNISNINLEKTNFFYYEEVMYS